MQTRSVTLVLAAALVVPAGIAAGWGGKGQFEPDTSFDVVGGYMWGATAIDTTRERTGHRLYFNAFTEQNTAYGLHGFSDNPNFARVDSQHAAWPGTLGAMLGVWKDCNKDGYIGFQDNALLEYRAELLLGDVSVCPLITGLYPISVANSHSFIPVHNDGQWIREYLPLGPDAVKAPLRDGNSFDLNDNGVRVWADWNKPGALPPTTRCNVVFPPEDSFHSTGSMLAMVDCVDGFAITAAFNAAVNAVGGDELGAGQVSFDDDEKHPDRSSSALNRPSPWGEPSGDSMATVFDCGQPALFETDVPATEYHVGVRNIGNPESNPDGNAGATVNVTENSLEDCDRADGGTFDAANAPYSPEKAGVSNYVDIKDQSDFPMGYSEGQRGFVPNHPLGPATATDSARAYDSEGFWTSETRIAEDRNPYVTRDDAGNLFAPVQWMTAYAFIPPSAVTKYQLVLSPTGKTAKYGAENCGASAGVSGSTDKQGWRCDPTRWYPQGCLYGCTGLVEGELVDMSVRVGQTYHLRDVDCYDSSVMVAREAGVHYGALSGTSCLD